jgi:hypothetical protein
MDGENVERVAFMGAVDNVTIRNLEIRRYHTADYLAAIEIDDPSFEGNNKPKGDYWVLDNLFVHHNRSHGINLGNHTTVTNSVISDNGVQGIGGREFVGGLIEGNTITGNATRNAFSGHGGGIKNSLAHGLVIRGNVVSGNEVVGIWCDSGCTDWTVENNTITNHRRTWQGNGILYEISSDAVIRNNFIDGAGRKWNPPRWAWGAGIQISTSFNVVISGNTVRNAQTGVAVIQQARSSVTVENILVDNITVTGNTLWDNRETVNRLTGVVTDTGEPSVYSRQFVFESNTYRGAREPRFWWQGGTKTLAQWQALGFDAGSQYQP